MDFKDYSREIAAGNQEAFLSFCRQYKDIVYQSALARLNNEKAAREVSRNVFFEVYRQLRHSSQPTGSFYTWLDGLVARECENYAPSVLDLEESAPPRRKIAREESFSSPAGFRSGKGRSFAPPHGDSFSPSPALFDAQPKKTEEPTLFCESAPKRPQPVPQVLREPSRPAHSAADSNRDLFDEAFPRKKKEQGKKNHPFLSAFGTFLLLCIALFLLWTLAGILMQLHILPFYDLGYPWFNDHIYPLF